jgi:RNA polymerase sigma-70 factor (ECF subfamily)
MLRKRRVRSSVQMALRFVMHSASAPTPEDLASQSDSDRRLWSAVDTLDDKHRMPIVLRYVHDLPVQEIAGILGISEGTVHSRLHYAREKLQKILTREDAPRRQQEEVGS